MAYRTGKEGRPVAGRAAAGLAEGCWAMGLAGRNRSHYYWLSDLAVPLRRTL